MVVRGVVAVVEGRAAEGRRAQRAFVDGRAALRAIGPARGRWTDVRCRRAAVTHTAAGDLVEVAHGTRMRNARSKSSFWNIVSMNVFRWCELQGWLVSIFLPAQNGFLAGLVCAPCAATPRPFASPDACAHWPADPGAPNRSRGARSPGAQVSSSSRGCCLVLCGSDHDTRTRRARVSAPPEVMLGRDPERRRPRVRPPAPPGLRSPSPSSPPARTLPSST